MTRPTTLSARPGPDRLDRAHGRLVGALDQQPVLLRGVAGDEGGVGVAVDAADERGDVDVDDVAVLDHGGVGDAVADDLVQARAARLREAAVAQRRRVRVVVDEELVDHPVHLVRGHPGSDGRAAGLQRLRGDPAGHPHGLDDLRWLHPRVRTAGGACLAHVLRTRDVRRDLAAGRERARGQQSAGGHGDQSRRAPFSAVRTCAPGPARRVGRARPISARRGVRSSTPAPRGRASPAAAPRG